MKIKNITAKNFKGKDLIDFSPNNVTYAIVGKNGSGKTSTQQAIRYALTGDYPNDPIKTGKSEMSVTTQLDDGTIFARSRNISTSKCILNGKTVTGTILKDFLETKSNVPMDGIKLCSSAELIENLKPEELGEFIMKYVPEELDIDIVKKYLISSEPDVIKLLEKYMPSGEKFSYEQISETYKLIFDYRKIAKKEMEERSARANSYNGEIPELTMEEVNKKLEEIIKKEGEYEGLRIANIAYRKAIESRELQLKNINELEKRINSIVATRPIPGKIEEIREQKQKIQNEIINLCSVLNSMNENVKIFTETIENLNKNFCPLSERLCCTTDKTFLKEEFETSIISTKEGIELQKKLIAEKKNEINVLLEKETEYNKNALAYKEKTTLMNQLNDKKTELIAVPIKPSEVPSDIEKIAEMKTYLYEMRNRILNYQNKVKALEEYNELYKNWKAADSLVSSLRPNGPVSTGITSFYFEVFEECCNETIKKIKPNYELKFVADKGVKIEFKKDSTGFIPYSSASSGERACVIFALMDLISNALTNLNIMILDDLDKLDKDTFDALISYIMDPDVQAKYDHIILCAVDHKDTVDTLKKYKDIDLNVIV